MATSKGKATGKSGKAGRSITEGKETPRRKSSTSGESRVVEGGGSRGITADKRHQMIALAAYCRAEARGFAAGCEQEDWLAAEDEIDGRTA